MHSMRGQDLFIKESLKMSGSRAPLRFCVTHCFPSLSPESFESLTRANRRNIVMSTNLKPWMKATFELIVHAETHLREGGDFDRRMAHIGFDNAIEVAISTYLGLNPFTRNNNQNQGEG